MARVSIEERNKSYKEFIINYLSKENWHDYENIAKLQDYPTIKKLPDALNFIKENMTEDVYRDFVRKAFPLEPNDVQTKEEVEELKSRLIKLATEINYNRAGLIDILENVDNINKYGYMVKHLRFKYGLIGASIYQSNTAYVNSASLYSKPDLVLSNAYTNITKEEEQKIRNIVKDRGLYLNNITYSAAYIYAKNHGLIKTTSKNK